MAKRIGLLGENISHSYSPKIFSLFGDFEYLLFPTSKENFEEFFKNNRLDGFNVTIPYKVKAMELCDTLSEEAKAIGCVNTVIRNSDGTSHGENTDVFGFEYMAEKINCDFSGKKVVVLGSGGSSRTVKYVAEKHGASEIVIISRTGENNYENIEKHTDADVIVNTTPVGMYPGNGKSPVDLAIFKSCKKVLDLIYNPSRSVLIQQAQELGIDCINGLYMLVCQAIRSANLLLGENIRDDVADSVYEQLEKEQKNIVFIGMPGCGKTTIGKLLAEKTGRDFVDTDGEIELEFGLINEFFKRSGEQEFRKIEKEVIERVCKESGTVISTGGGVVLLPENITAIRENATVVYLDAPLGRLEMTGRPLSRDRMTLMKMYFKRAKLYEKCADFKVEVSPDPEETLRSVIECISL
ncbi:MAG: AAA family ATPase [Clostridia bacterium]|nr:AAA family ATPase [Clostridia bacterium]